MLTIFRLTFSSHPYRAALAITWLILIFSLPNSFQIISDYIGFLFVGIIGAIFANSTGAGGGVVFVPFFNQIDMQNSAIIATSFAIQCCGMTAGALTWHYHRQSLLADDSARTGKSGGDSDEWLYVNKGLLITIPFSILGILTAQFALSEYTQQMQTSLHVAFGVFSILLAIAIFGSIPLLNRQKSAINLLPIDMILLGIIAFFGGVITAWLSVGVGELIAVYLILRGFNVTSAIALAVILSAFTVWSAIFNHLFITQAIYWNILLFAGAGAIIGGVIAKRVVLYFCVVKLKLFFATWVFIMGTVGLIT
ncbi:MAG: putative membrane protein YfcA [Glaciecola sp.]